MSATEVWVSRANYGMDIDIAIVRNQGEEQLVARVDEDGRLRFIPVARGTYVAPTICLPRQFAEQLLKGLLDERVPAPTVGAVEGELKATKYHLEDLRKMLKVSK